MKSEPPQADVTILTGQVLADNDHLFVYDITEGPAGFQLWIDGIIIADPYTSLSQAMHGLTEYTKADLLGHRFAQVAESYNEKVQRLDALQQEVIEDRGFIMNEFGLKYSGWSLRIEDGNYVITSPKYNTVVFECPTEAIQFMQKMK